MVRLTNMKCICNFSTKRLILGESLASLSGRKGGKGDDSRRHDRDGCNDRGRHDGGALVRIVWIIGIVCIVPLQITVPLHLHPPPGVNST